MEFLLIGMAVALNIIFIKFKFDKGRYADASMDAALLVLVTVVFSGTYGALVVGTIASVFISIYLYISPPKLGFDPSEVLDKFKQRAGRKGLA